MRRANPAAIPSRPHMPQTRALLAGVPEALSVARIWVIPAQPRRRRRACVNRRSPCSEHADSRAGRDRAARAPAIPAGPRPAAVYSAVDATTVVAVAATIHPAAVDAAAIGTAGNGAAAMVDAAAGSHSGDAAMGDIGFRDHPVAQLR